MLNYNNLWKFKTQVDPSASNGFEHTSNQYTVWACGYLRLEVDHPPFAIKFFWSISVYYIPYKNFLRNQWWSTSTLVRYLRLEPYTFEPCSFPLEANGST